ncbi:MAG: hypothetical protein SGI73_21620 [Chloroflexota bacterium]|nr:hypothetical protein [Chloroflexota bacterium]
MTDYLPNLIISLGTQVVLDVDIRNSVGEIVKQPPDGTHAYRVRLIDNVEVSVKRGEVAFIYFLDGLLVTLNQLKLA